MKRSTMIISIVAIVALVAVFAVLMNQTGEITDINEVVGESLTLDAAAPYVHELADSEMDDDFSRAVVGKTTIEVVSLDAENETAEVKLYAPDIEKIMLANIPEDLSGDFDALFEKYCADVSAAIANATEDEMISETLTCPVVSGEEGTKVSIEGAPILNYQKILAEILVVMAMGGEVE
jgi:hypothetical protein